MIKLGSSEWSHIELFLMEFFSIHSAVVCLLNDDTLDDQDSITRCICPLGWFTDKCRIKDSVNIMPIVLTDPSWDDYSSKSSFKLMEYQICEEMGNIFGAERVWCRLIYSRKGRKVNATIDGFSNNKQDEPMDNGHIEPYDTPCWDRLCASYEKCSYKGMGYRCQCKLFKYGKPCRSDAKGCDGDYCGMANRTCPEMEDCYKCDCNLFKLEQVCEYAIFNLLLSAVVTSFTIAILVFICLDRHRGSRSKYG